MPLDPSFVPRLHRKARLRFDRHAGEHLIVYPERGLALNESAAAIATRCDGTRSIAAIVDELVALAGGSAERAAITGDVVAFVEGLAARGLLEP